MSRSGILLVRGLALSSIGFLGAVILLDTLDGWPGGAWQALVITVNTSVGLVYLGVGWLLAERQPRNPIGPLILVLGVMYAVAGPVDLYLSLGREQALSRLAALLMMAVGYPINLCLVVALILFPNGAPPSRRWWWIIAIVVAGSVVGVAAMAFGSTTFGPVYPSIQSPFAIPGFPKRSLLSIADTILAMTTLAGVAAVAIRWRGGSALVRAQTTWVLAAVAVMFLTDRLARQVDDDWNLITASLGLLQNATLALIPLSMAVAILRYRLYEIDRIVSRTIGWAIVSAVMVGGLTLAIVVLSGVFGRVAVTSLLGIPADETAVVALSTLVVAASFQPVRRRVQAMVDRWFHRTHYDAGRTVDGFAGRLRRDPSLGALTGELCQTSVEAFEPSVAAIWLRRGGTP